MKATHWHRLAEKALLILAVLLLVFISLQLHALPNEIARAVNFSIEDDTVEFEDYGTDALSNFLLLAETAVGTGEQ
jgi:hypothetical protein